MHIVAERNGADGGRAATTKGVGESEHRRDDVARMSAAAGEDVVAVEVARHHAVGEGGEFRQGPLVGPKNAGAFTGPHARSQIARYPAWLRVKRRDGAAQRVNDAPLAFVHDRSGQALPSSTAAVIGNLFDEIVYSHTDASLRSARDCAIMIRAWARPCL